MRCSTMVGVPLSGFLFSGCSTLSILENFGRSSQKKSKAQMLAAETVSDLSSSGPMVLHSARVIIDDAAALQNKLNLIKNAESEIRIVYRKYNDDLAGSVFTNELINSTKERNLKVKVLVDFWTNYERLDFFTYLEKAGEGRIQVKFYGIPSEKIVRGAMYETSTCNPAKTLASTSNGIPCEFPTSPSWFSRVFLSGLYGRNQTMMTIAKRLSQIYSKDLDSKQVNDLADEILKADLSEAVDSENEFVLALEAQNSPLGSFIENFRGQPLFESGHAQFLQHATDYTNHRLLVVDGFRFQLGGRDLEDTKNTVNADFYGESAAALNIQAAFDRLFSFAPMVGDIAMVQSLAPNDYTLNPVPFQKSLALCLLAMKPNEKELQACVDSNMTRAEEYETLDARLEYAAASMLENAQHSQKNRSATLAKSWKPGGDQIETTDLAGIKAYYLENLTFTKKDPSQRLYVPESDLAQENGKYVHSLWNKSLENTCAVAQATRSKKRVVIQSDALFLPGNLVQTLGKMMNGQWKCKNVEISLISNSTDRGTPTLTDIFSRYQVQSLLRFHTTSNHEAKLRFYEYRSTTDDGRIHFKTNLSVFGDDLLVGSIDGNIRSYAVDTGAAVFLRNAAHSVNVYTSYIDGLIKSGHLIDLTDYYASASAEDLHEESFEALRALLPKARDSTLLTELGTELKTTTRQVLELAPPPSSVRAPASAGLPTPAEIIQRHDETWKSF